MFRHDSREASTLGVIRRLEREKGAITLIFSAKNEIHNNVVVLREVLKKRAA